MKMITEKEIQKDKKAMVLIVVLSILCFLTALFFSTGFN